MRGREIEEPFLLAVTLLEHAEWLMGQGRMEQAGPLLEESESIFQSLSAVPWLERAARAAAPNNQLQSVRAEAPA